MTLPEPLIGVANHVWQSTFFAAAIALVCAVLRNHRAGVRHALWVCASVRFLVPASALVALASDLPRRNPPKPLAARHAITALAQPFDNNIFELPPSPRLPPRAPLHSAAVTGLFVVWIGGSVCVLFVYAADWRRWRGRVQRAQPAAGFGGAPPGLPVLISHEPIDAAVVGVFRPVLLLPATMTREEPAKVSPLIAHELAHIRRRDNLTSAVHAAVEAIFWFHPLVWWLGARMLRDRERACDEAALDSGFNPEFYAESLLHACRNALARRGRLVACAAGWDLNGRIRSIMAHHRVRKLSAAQSAVLGAFLVASIGAPAVGGLLAPRPANAQERSAPAPLKFDVASIKPNTSGGAAGGMFPSPGRLTIRNYSLERLVLDTYHLKRFQLDGAKGWMQTDHWDIEAVFPVIAGRSNFQGGLDRLPSLLEERFHFASHREIRQLPVFTLSIAKGGPKLKASDLSDGKQGWYRELAPRADPTGITTFRMDFKVFSNALGGKLNLPLVDSTGITGNYDITLTFTPQDLLDMPEYTGHGVSVFTAIQEQLGLKLEAGKGPVEVLVIDRAEKPGAN